MAQADESSALASLMSQTHLYDEQIRYTYSSLSHSDSIRLLELQPGRADDPIVCFLQTTRLQEKPQYDSISYVWGNAQELVEVFVDNIPLLVTQNLHDALRQVRSTAQMRVIWADAICIDQGNVKERGHQVGLMADIYRHARQVWICLGDDTQWIGGDIMFILHQLLPIIDRDLRRYGTLLQIPATDPKDLAPYLSLPWRSLRRLRKHPWFHRLWVLQEIGLSKRGTILFGTTCIDWVSLMKLIFWVAKSAPKILLRHSLPGYGIVTIWYSFNPDERREFRTPRRPHTFLHLLHLVRRRHRATDARDHLYGFLGHPTSMKDKVSSFVDITYEKTTASVYLEFALNIIQEEKNLAILPFAGHGAVSMGHMGIPSWCPRWDVFFDQPYPLDGKGGNRHYRASKREGCEFEIVNNGRELRVKGFVLDIATSHVLPLSRGSLYYGADSSAMKQLETYLSSAISLTGRTKDIMRACHLAFTGGIRMDEEGSKAGFERFSSYIHPVASKLPNLDKEALEEIEALSGAWPPTTYISVCSSTIWYRSLFLTHGNRLCLGPQSVVEDDLCCILYGSRVPILLRPTGQDKYTVVGDAYIEGAMFGEAMELLNEDKVTEMWFGLT